MTPIESGAMGRPGEAGFARASSPVSPSHFVTVLSGAMAAGFARALQQHIEYPVCMSGAPTHHRKQRKSWNEPGHAHELTFSCHRRLALLSKNRTRLWLLEALDQARCRWDFAVWAYVIMPEHVHILIHPRAVNYDIALILKAIKQPVSQRTVAFLRKNAPAWLDHLRVTRACGRSEYRFWQQGGGYDRNIIREETAWTCVEYIHANPVRRELVATPADWPWSSARWYAGLDEVKLEMDEPPPWPSLTRHGRRRST